MSSSGGSHSTSVTGIGRFLAKCAIGQAVKIGAVGDSGLAGGTVASGLDADGNAVRVGVLGTDDLLSLVAAATHAKYGNVVTTSNRAVSGHTVASAFSQKVSAFGNVVPITPIISDAADLYLIAYGHNEIKGFTAGAVQGLGQNTALRLLEHLFRRLRKDVPGADLMFVSEWPYLAEQASSDVSLVTYNKAVRLLCASYGVEFVDGYKAFADRGAAASRKLIDATNHPNADGHAVWASAPIGHLPAPAPATTSGQPTVPNTSLYQAHRIGPRSLVELAAPNNGTGAGNYGTDRMRLLPTAGSGWDTQVAFPATTSLAGDSIQVWWVGADALLRLDTGAGQGVVNIDVDGIRVYSNLDLSTKPAGQSYIPLPAAIGGTDAPPSGIHAATVTVVTPPATVRGFVYAVGGVEWWALDSPRNTYTGADWGATNVTNTTFNGQSKILGSGFSGESVSFDFIGTKFGILGFRYNITPRNLTVTVDGVVSTVDFGGNLQGGASTLFAMGAYDLATGLPFGRHSVTIAATGTTGSWQLHAFYCVDETRLRRPTRQRGYAVVGDAVRYAEPFPGRPALDMAAKGAGDAYETTPTTTGFTMAGTAALGAAWEAEGDQITV